MNMLEERDHLLKGWTVEILASDLNDHSIEAAEAGIDGEYALRNPTDYYKRKYFSTVDEIATSRAWTWYDSPLNSTKQSNKSTHWSRPCLAQPHRQANPSDTAAKQ